ncbi:Glycoside hydrolase 131 catalytic N-terminal domain-containing protein [Abortiporus biennis]
MQIILPILLVASLASATVVWDVRFNDYSTAADFDKWSWSNQVGSYQTYIYGNLHGETASSWLTLGSQFKNPSTTAENQGVKVKINSTSTWNGGPMLRTELLPQTTNALTGHLYFHVSLQIPTVNPPDPAYEHQIVFWEEHYADIKYGQLSGQSGVADTLQVITGGQSIWSVTPVKGTWYNFILETGSPDGLWVSTGSSALQKVFTGSLNGNGGTDWHVGALRLPINGQTQQINETDIYYSGIYVEDSGPTTTP